MADTQVTDWKLMIVIGVLFASLIALAIYQHNLLMKQNAQLQSAIIDQKKIVDEVVRSQSSLATKQDLENQAKNLGLKLDPIIKDIESLGGKLDGINNVTVVSTPQSYTGLASSGTTGRVLAPVVHGTISPPITVADPKNPDPFGYLTKRQFLTLNEQFGSTLVPLGEVGFSSWQAKPWDEKILQREYNVSTVLGVNEEGRHLVYNNFSMKVNGKDYKIPIQTAKFEEIYPTSEFRFNPRLYLSLGAGINITKVDGSVNGSAEVALFSYGPTKIDSYWRIVSPGVGYDPVAKDFLITFTPAAYNLGKNLVLTQNLFVGPQITYGLNNNWSILLGVSAGL